MALDPRYLAAPTHDDAGTAANEVFRLTTAIQTATVEFLAEPAGGRHTRASGAMFDRAHALLDLVISIRRRDLAGKY